MIKVLFSLFVFFTMGSYVYAETWACFNEKMQFVMQRNGNKFEVLTGKKGSNLFDIVSESRKNIVIMRNLNEQYAMIFLNKETKKYSDVYIHTEGWEAPNVIGVGVSSASGGNCRVY